MYNSMKNFCGCISTLTSEISKNKDFYAFKKSAQKEVSYLVKEFECKKSAGAYARATTSRTGVLDTTKLINYRFSEDIFKKVTVVPDGKNHGLVFILDWSGSMNNVMMDTLKQLYNLIWFCVLWLRTITEFIQHIFNLFYRSQ